MLFRSTLADYMRYALGHPEHGYYATRDPLGRDFVTAPEVSQMFGELVGMLLLSLWEQTGRPQDFVLLEMGPGRGTLMADLLRAAKIRPDFLAAAHVCLLETSPALRALQEKTVSHPRLQWVQNFDAVPAERPLFAIANEFFDALPIRQFERIKGQWHERMVGAEDGALVLKLAPQACADPALPPDAPEGAIYEICPEARALTAALARHIARKSGAALLIDYGHAQSGFGDTFQAMKAHRYADPFAEPGETDLTAHADFAALAKIAEIGRAHV